MSKNDDPDEPSTKRSAKSGKELNTNPVSSVHTNTKCIFSNEKSTE